jgi:antitoxin ParD1/3/4
MNISLTLELESMVHHKVASGRYTSASEVVREALRLMDDRDQLFALQKDEIRRKITAGMNSLRAGKSSDSEAYFDRVDTELDEIDSCASK